MGLDKDAKAVRAALGCSYQRAVMLKRAHWERIKRVASQSGKSIREATIDVARAVLAEEAKRRGDPVQATPIPEEGD